MARTETDSRGRSGQGSYIAADCALEGTFTFSGPLTIAGHMKGPVKSDAMVLIEATGELEGSLEAPVIIVHGKLSGTITAHESVEIWTDAKVTGKVTTRSIRVDAGSLLTADLVVATEGNLPAHESAEVPDPTQAADSLTGEQERDPSQPARPLPGSNLARKLAAMNENQ